MGRFDFKRPKADRISVPVTGDMAEKIKLIAIKAKVTMPGVAEQLLLVGLEEYEKENGKVKS